MDSVADPPGVVICQHNLFCNCFCFLKLEGFHLQEPEVWVGLLHLQLHHSPTLTGFDPCFPPSVKKQDAKTYQIPKYLKLEESSCQS